MSRWPNYQAPAQDRAGACFAETSGGESLTKQPSLFHAKCLARWIKGAQQQLSCPFALRCGPSRWGTGSCLAGAGALHAWAVLKAGAAE
jgi:hypothetical protein